MWHLRLLPLDPATELTEGCLLPAPLLAEQQQAHSLLQHTQQHCAERIQEAEQQAALILAQARQEAEQQIQQQQQAAEHRFWQQAQQLFAGWEQARQQENAALLTRTTELVQTLFRQLLIALPDADKLQAQLTQLLQASEHRHSEAVLYFHPQHETLLQHWLHAHPHLPWRLNADEQQPSDSLLLHTAQGEFSLSWAVLEQRILQSLQ